jgi:hypothetical protein
MFDYALRFMLLIFIIFKILGSFQNLVCGTKIVDVNYALRTAAFSDFNCLA